MNIQKKILFSSASLLTICSIQLSLPNKAEAYRSHEHKFQDIPVNVARYYGNSQSRLNSWCREQYSGRGYVYFWSDKVWRTRRYRQATAYVWAHVKNLDCIANY